MEAGGRAMLNERIHDPTAKLRRSFQRSERAAYRSIAVGLALLALTLAGAAGYLGLADRQIAINDDLNELLSIQPAAGPVE